MGAPRATRARMSLEEMARAGISIRWTRPAAPGTWLTRRSRSKPRPGGGDELGLGEDLVGLLPGEDLEDRVGPGDEEQAGVLGMLAPQLRRVSTV